MPLGYCYYYASRGYLIDFNDTKINIFNCNNPFIFKDTTSMLLTGCYEPVPVNVRIKTGFEELERLSKETGEKHACLEMRKRFAAYSKGIENGAALRAQIVHASTIEDYKNIFKEIIK